MDSSKNKSESTMIEQTIQATFDQLEDCLKQAHDLVPVADASQLVTLLPATSEENQRFIVSELVKLDMQAASMQGQVRLLDFYLPKLSDWLGHENLSLDLILEELQVRRGSGQAPKLSEYQSRFPSWADALADFRWDQDNNTVAQSVSRTWNLHQGLPEFQVGQVVDDFRILRKLGRGAFAHVYLARQESMQRLVALKISSRGTDEPQTLSQLDHANIVRVYDQRILPQHQIHLLYMQVVLGGPLSSVVAATKQVPLERLNGRTLLESVDQAMMAVEMPPPDRSRGSELTSLGWAATTAWLGAQLADGLQAAHQRGVYHCDVKPANILLSPEGVPMLVDFNVSYSESTRDKAGSIGGTLAYMSPEHLAAVDPTHGQPKTPLDGRTDLYSLAIVLWEVWQGQRPWQFPGQSETWKVAVAKQSELRRQEPQCSRPDSSSVGAWLERVLRQSLDPDPERRPKNCAELSTRLRLATHPELASRFAPSEGSIIHRLLRWPVLMVTAAIIFASNGSAGALNYAYNHAVIILQNYEQLLPNFVFVSTVLNAVAFPFGAAVLVYFCWRVRRALRRAAGGLPAKPEDIDFVWKFGHRASVICVVLWLIFGILFPLAMSRYDSNFQWAHFVHFFLSLSICGGIAWIYPFYGISLLSALVYYPQLIAPTMQDDQYAQRASWLKKWAGYYLVSAAAIPLLSLGVLTQRTDAPRDLVLLIIGLTLVALAFSYRAHQRLIQVLDQYAVLLSPQKSGGTVR
jgi:serine/threonine protein kinase